MFCLYGGRISHAGRKRTQSSFRCVPLINEEAQWKWNLLNRLTSRSNARVWFFFFFQWIVNRRHLYSWTRLSSWALNGKLYTIYNKSKEHILKCEIMTTIKKKKRRYIPEIKSIKVVLKWLPSRETSFELLSFHSESCSSLVITSY